MLTALLCATLAVHPAGELLPQLPAEAEPLARALSSQVEAKDWAAALATAAELRRANPDSARVHLFIGWRLLHTGHGSSLDDLNRALELRDGLTKTEVVAAHVLRGEERLSRGLYDDAGKDAEAALALDPDSAAAIGMLLQKAIYSDNESRIRRWSAELARVRPESFLPSLIGAQLAHHEGADGEARALLEDAIKKGAPPEQTEKLLRELRDARLGSLAWQIPVAGAGLLIGSMALLWLLGLLLGGAMRGVSAEGKGAGEWLVLRAYDGVLLLAVVLFYAGAPFVMGFSVLTAAAVIFVVVGFFNSVRSLDPRVYILLFGLVVASVMGVIGTFIGFFASSKRKGPPCKVLTREEAPELHALVEETAKVASSRNVDRIEVELEPNVHVREEGSSLASLFKGGTRVLGIGLAAMRGLTITQVKAVLTHEHGHLAHGDTRGLALVAGVSAKLAGIRENYVSLGTFGALNPVYWYVASYLALLRTLAAAASRRKELRADRVAAEKYGGLALTGALEGVARNGALYSAAMVPLAIDTRRHGVQLTGLLIWFEVLWKALPEASRALFLVPPAPRADDSHPPHSERAAAVAKIAASEPVDPRTWETVIPGVVAWEAELEAKLIASLDRQLEAANELPREFTRPTNEESLAAALGAHSDACRAFGAAPVKESLAALAASEAAISTAMGPGSRLHVAVMRRIVLAQLRAGALEEAATSAERLLVLLPNDELHALDRSQVEQLRQTALSNLPVASRPAPAAATDPMIVCAGCSSASRESELEKAQKCPWCGAAWTRPA